MKKGKEIITQSYTPLKTWKDSEVEITPLWWKPNLNFYHLAALLLIFSVLIKILS